MLYSKFTGLNVNLIHKLPSTKTPRKLFDQILRHPSPVGATYKINHRSDQEDRERKVRKIKDWVALWLLSLDI